MVLHPRGLNHHVGSDERDSLTKLVGAEVASVIVDELDEKDQSVGKRERLMALHFSFLDGPPSAVKVGGRSPSTAAPATPGGPATFLFGQCHGRWLRIHLVIGRDSEGHTDAVARNLSSARNHRRSAGAPVSP